MHATLFSLTWMKSGSFVPHTDKILLEKLCGNADAVLESSPHIG